MINLDINYIFFFYVLNNIFILLLIIYIIYLIFIGSLKLQKKVYKPNYYKISDTKKYKQEKNNIINNSNCNSNPPDPDDWWSRLKKWIKNNPIKTTIVCVSFITLCIILIKGGSNEIELPPEEPEFTRTISIYNTTYEPYELYLSDSHKLWIAIGLLLKALNMTIAQATPEMAIRMYRIPAGLDASLLSMNSPLRNLHMIHNLNISYKQEIVLLTLLCTYMTVDIHALPWLLNFYMEDIKLINMAVTQDLTAMEVLSKLKLNCYHLFGDVDKQNQVVVILLKLAKYWHCDFIDLPKKIKNIIYVINNVPDNIQWIAKKLECSIQAVPLKVDALVVQANLDWIHKLEPIKFNHKPEWYTPVDIKSKEINDPRILYTHIYIRMWLIDHRLRPYYTIDKLQILDCLFFLAKFFKCSFTEIGINIQYLLDAGIIEFKNDVNKYVPFDKRDNPFKWLEFIKPAYMVANQQDGGGTWIWVPAKEHEMHLGAGYWYKLNWPAMMSRWNDAVNFDPQLPEIYEQIADHYERFNYRMTPGPNRSANI